MCICCCPSRKSLLIYAIIVSVLAFIFGIVGITQFASKTEVYKALKERIDLYDSLKYLLQNNRNLDYYDDNYYYTTNVVLSALDAESMTKINSLTAEDFESNNYSLIKRLKGIENGLGTILLIFPIIFLAAEVVYLIFICHGEYQVMKVKTFAVLNVFKIITHILSTIFIFLAIFYGVILFVIMLQYIALVENVDSCVYKLLIGQIFGYYSFWYYITLACIFGREHTLFKQVGTAANPGIMAQMDINGNPIVRAAVVTAPQIYTVAPSMVIQPVNIAYQNGQEPYQQVPFNNQSQP